MDIKTKIIEKTGFEEVMTVDDGAMAGSSSVIIIQIKDNNSVSEIIDRMKVAIITDTHYGARKGCKTSCMITFEMFYR